MYRGGGGGGGTNEGPEGFLGCITEAMAQVPWIKKKMRLGKIKVDSKFDGRKWYQLN